MEQLVAINEKRLWNKKMDKGGDFDDHVKTMRKLVKEACKVGAVVSDSQFWSILLDSFPLSWDQNTVNIPGTTSEGTINHLEALWAIQEDRQNKRLLEQEKVKMLATRTTPTGQLVPSCWNC